MRVPVLAMTREVSIRMPPEAARFAVIWTPDSPLSEEDPPQRDSGPRAGYLIYPFDDNAGAVAIRDVGWLLKNPKMFVAVDATSVKPDELGKLLNRWFSNKPNG